MIKINNSLLNLSLCLIATLALTACGGGGGASTSNNSFNSNNTNTKPQSTSSETAQVASSISSTTHVNISSSSSAETSTIKSSAVSTSKASSAKSNVLTSSKSSSRNTTVDVTPPSPPLNFTEEAAFVDQVILKWKPATDNVGVAFYTIYRDQVQIDAVYSSDTNYYDFAVAAGKTYTYSIGAVDTSGNWSKLNSIEISTPAFAFSSSKQSSSKATSAINNSASQATSSTDNNTSQTSSSTNSNTSKTSSSINNSASQSSTSTAADTTLPTTPGQVNKISAYSSQVDINWTAATDNIGVTSYRVYRDNLLLSTVGASTLNYSDKTASPEMSYWYGVSAGDAAGNWSTQKLVNISTPAPLASGSVTLKWLPPTQRENGATLPPNEIGGYSIRYRLATDTVYTYVPVDKSQTSISFNDLIGDYIFEIAVYDANGLYSNFVTIMPQ